MIQRLGNLSYEDRPKLLNLLSLETGRVRGNMLKVFKWMWDFNNSDINKIVIVNEPSRTRSNGLNLGK